MAKVFRQPITRYVGPDGKRGNKNTPGAKMVKNLSSKYYGRVKTPNGKWKKVPLSTDKEVSKKRLAKLIAEADSTKFRLTDPYAEHLKRPLLDHLNDYVTFLKGKDRGTPYTAKQHQRIRDAAAGCEFEFLTDIDEGKLVAYLKRRRDGAGAVPKLDKEQYPAGEVAKLLGRGAQTVSRVATRQGIPHSRDGRHRVYPRASVQKLLEWAGQDLSTSSSNGYAVAFKGFTRWLVRNRRLGDDPLQGLETLNAKKDRRHKRRVLPADSVLKLLDAARTGPAYGTLSGFDREMIYSVAVYTGLRAQELAALSPSHFDAGLREVTLSGAETKNGQDARIPLRRELAALLKPYLVGRPAHEPVWPGSWYRTAAEMLRVDLAAAGIPYRDPRGEVFDFHCLRRQFVSDLVRGNVNPKVAQVLARHSTIQMTMDVYAELGEGDELAKAIAASPGYHPVTQAPDSSGQSGAASGSERPERDLP